MFHEHDRYLLSEHTGVGKVVAVSVRVSIGQPLASWEQLYQAIETLGGEEIRNVQDREPYAFVAITGEITEMLLIMKPTVILGVIS